MECPKARRATASQPLCTTRRRTKPYSPRRRPSQQAAPCPAHAFDQLPWIAALERTPDALSPSDLADLSQIPDPPASRSVRRQRAAPDLVPSSRATPRAPTPPCDTTPPFSLRPTPPSRPTTPLSRFIPSRVLFHNLMPVLCDDQSSSPPTPPSLFHHLLSPNITTSICL
ncbi:hypothetical protein H0H87_004969 [Tephrocybe sp. NHM501043]|nr:hypothetical protein H0H87_004969 [Tephrocybe sp. NHM501043]